MKESKKLKNVPPLADTLSENALVSNSKFMMNEVVIKFKKNPDIKLPKYAHPGDAGMDVYATGVEYLVSWDAYLYHTGLYCESDKNVCCFLMPRSSNMKTEAYMPNSIGLVDTVTYRGEICFIFKNRTNCDVAAGFMALKNLSNMPWYKRIFTSFVNEWDKCCEDVMDNPMDWAPYKVGERIGQLVFFAHPSVIIEEVDELSETARGEGGFGSTGK